MVFNSLEFLIFYPAVLVMYFLAPQKWRWVLLLAASYYFYLSWNVELVFLIVFTTAVSYVSALVIEKKRGGTAAGENASSCHSSSYCFGSMNRSLSAHSSVPAAC